MSYEFDCVVFDPCPDCGIHAACECWRGELDLEDQLECHNRDKGQIRHNNEE